MNVLSSAAKVKTDNRIASLDKARRSRAAFRVLVTVDPGRGHPRTAFVGRMQGGTARLPQSISGMNLVCTGTVRTPALQTGNISLDTTGEIVFDVLAPGDLIVLKPHTKGPVHETVVEAVRHIPLSGAQIVPHSPSLSGYIRD